MAKDIFHYSVRVALEKEGWTITADPLKLKLEDETFEPDLAAERMLSAEKEKDKIAVEIKSFVNQSFKRDFYEAIGQYVNYQVVLAEVEPDRKLVLAIPIDTYETHFHKAFVQKVIEKNNISVIVYQSSNQSITLWVIK